MNDLEFAILIKVSGDVVAVAMVRGRIAVEVTGRGDLNNGWGAGDKGCVGSRGKRKSRGDRGGGREVAGGNYRRDRRPTAITTAVAGTAGAM